MIDRTDPAIEFVKHLVWLNDERNHDPHRRGELAALRRGLGKEPGQAPEMHQYVVPFLPDRVDEAHERAYYLVAALFAWHTENWASSDPWRTNLGASFAQIADRSSSVERRFMALLSCDVERLPYHLRQAIGLLRAKDVPVNWRLLIEDLQHWDDPARIVQRRWARSFWGVRRPDGQTPEPSPKGEAEHTATEGVQE